MSIIVAEKGGLSGAALKSYVDNFIATERLDPTDRDLTRLYTTSFIGRRAANKRGDAVASVKMKILDSKNEPLSETRPEMKLLARNYRDNARRAEITLCFWGRNLFFKRRSYNGSPYALRWVNPNQYMLDVRTSGLRGFQITRMYKHEEIPVHYIPRPDSMYMTELDFDNDYDGVSAMEVGFRHAQLGVEMVETQTNFMQNRAVPAAIVQPMSDDITKLPSTEDTTLLRNMLKRLYQGAKNAGRTLLQTYRWEWIQLQGDWDKMDFGVQFDQYIEAVAMAFDMPVPILRESANFAQTREMRRDWAHNWLVPRVEWYAESYTEQLLGDAGLVRKYGTGLVCKPDLESAALLKEDEKETIEKTNAKLNAGYIDLYTAALRAGEKAPDERLRGMYMWGNSPTPIVVITDLWKYKTLGAPSVYNAELITGEPLPQPVDPNQVVPTDVGGKPVDSPQVNGNVTPVVDKSVAPEGRSANISLSLANNPDLMALQRQVAAYMGETAVEWSKPDTFHITLISIPNITDEQIAVLKSLIEDLTVSDMTLRVGSLNVFPNVGKYAVHFKLRRNTLLSEFQADLYDDCFDKGLALSSFSQPGQYKPHITMGYGSTKPKAWTFESRLTVKPTAIRFIVDKVTIVEKSLTDDEPPPTAAAKSTDWIADDVFSELKVAARKGAEFVPDKLPKLTAAYMAALCGAGLEREHIIEAGKSHYLTFHAAKAIQSARLEFEGELETLISRALNDDATRQQFRSKLAALLNKYNQQAYMDGLRDGGLEDDEAELSDADRQAIAAHLATQSAYVSGLTDRLYKGEGISELQAVGKPGQWWNGSVYPSYLAGMEAAGSDPLLTWTVDYSKENCESCLALDGVTLRLSEFMAADLYPNSERLLCGQGKQCGCAFTPARGKRKGKLDGVPTARSAPHEHVT